MVPLSWIFGDSGTVGIKDPLFLGALGNEFFRQKMWNNAGKAYDMWILKVLAITGSNDIEQARPYPVFSYQKVNRGLFNPTDFQGTAVTSSGLTLSLFKNRPRLLLWNAGSRVTEPPRYLEIPKFGVNCRPRSCPVSREE
jgi:hypothetical protein